MKYLIIIGSLILAVKNIYCQSDSISYITRDLKLEKDTLKSSSFKLLSIFQIGGLKTDLILGETKHSSAIGFGLNVHYMLRKITIISGLEYQQYATKSKHHDTKFSDKKDFNTGIYLPLYNSLDSIQTNHYLTIPIGFIYPLELSSKSKVNFSTGIGTNFFLKQNNKVFKKFNNEIMEREKIDSKHKERFFLSSFYFITFENSISSKLKFQIGPRVDFQHSLNHSPNYKVSLFTGLTF